jgi:iron complex transport system substrate-binding protein
VLASRWHGQSARAQQADGARRIGVLLPYADNDPEAQSHLSAITQELKRLGWSQDRNIRIDARFAAGIADQYPLLAKELAALQPDVMLSESTPAAAALKQETRSIPIVFVGVSDPVGSGLVTSLARPGGDLTGMMQYESGIMGKWLAMLKEVAPRLTRVAFVANPKFRGYEYFWRSAEAAARALAIEIIPNQISNNAADIEHAIESFAQMPEGGLLFVPDATIIAHRDLVIRPDLVLTFSDLQADIAATLIRHGIEVHAFNQRTVPQILDMIKTLGSLISATDRAERLAHELAASVVAAREQAAQLPRRPKVYFEEWDDPMISGIGWVSELVEVAGGVDIFADRSSCKSAKDRIVTAEEVIRNAPDIIIGSWCGKKFRPEKVAQRPGFDCIPAVKRGALHEIKSSLILQPGPAALTDGLAALQSIIASAMERPGPS